VTGWHPDPAAEVLLRSGGDGTRDEVAASFRYLVGSFAAYLAAPLEVVWEPRYEDVSPGRWGWACGVRSAEPIGGPLRLEWYAVLGCDPHSDPYALVLLFAGGDRLIRLPRREYLSFDYPITPAGTGAWAARGWESSEMGDEFDGYQQLDELCRRFRTPEE
jgi:hypothetical protein